MEQRATLPGIRTHEYALGLYVDTYKGVREVDHSGGTARYSAHLGRYPDQQVSVAVLCNVAGANATAFAKSVAELYLIGFRPAVPPTPTTPIRTVIIVVLALPLLLDRPRGEQHVFTGTIREWKAGEPITVASEQTDPAGFTARLHQTRYEGRADQIATGSSVTSWYRIVGESLPVVDKVRVNEGRPSLEPIASSVGLAIGQWHNGSRR